MTSRALATILCLLLTACASVTSEPAASIPTDPPSPDPTIAGLPNPASVYCQQQGGKSEIRTNADNSQTGYCVFTDGSECDEWAYYRGECNTNTGLSDPSLTPGADPSSPTPIPTAVAIDPSFYQGFWTYTHPDYGFSIMLPEDWVVDETSTSDPSMNSHTLILRPQAAPDGTPSLRMSFRKVGDETLLWPTGVGQGEFVSGGTLEVAGAPVRRIYLVCPGGQIQSIYYQGGENQPNIQRGNLEFGFIYSYNGAYCQPENNLTGKVQLVGEMIIASLKVP